MSSIIEMMKLQTLADSVARRAEQGQEARRQRTKQHIKNPSLHLKLLIAIVSTYAGSVIAVAAINAKLIS